MSFDPIHPLTGPVDVEGALFSIRDGHAVQGAARSPARPSRCPCGCPGWRVHGAEGADACALASTVADLKIAEVVGVPHMLVTMQLPRSMIPGHPGPDLVPAAGWDPGD